MIDTIFIILYFLGAICDCVLIWKYIIKHYAKVTIGDVFGIIFLSIFSWLTFIIGVIVLYGDIVIYKPKDKEYDVK